MSPHLTPIDAVEAATQLPFDRGIHREAELFRECLAGLQVVRPDLTEDWVLGYRVFRDRFAQAICTTNFASRVPPVRSRIPGLLLTDSTQLYPSDRTISGMFGQAKKVAELIGDGSA